MPSFYIHAIPHDDWEMDDDQDILLPDNWPALASQVAQAAGIGITRDRDVAYLALSDEGDVVGVAWTAFDRDTYEFDVAVLPAWQGHGVGRQLLDRVISPPDLGWNDEPVDMTQRVVSPIMLQALAARGFIVTDVRQFHLDGLCDVSMRPYQTIGEALSPLYHYDADTYVRMTAQWLERHPEQEQTLEQLLTYSGAPNKAPEPLQQLLRHITQAFSQHPDPAMPLEICGALAGLRGIIGERQRVSQQPPPKTEMPDTRAMLQHPRRPG